ncbi:MAG: acyl-CoA dehydrogenase family protein [Bdellovibrionales bacterium]|nr:acyl-CoA dehydrogenase family protein [Bdellovibrionales bacterium]
MDFSQLTESQEAVQKLAEEFARKEILPHVEKIEKAAEYPTAIYRKAIEAGLMLLPVPEAYGGPGLGYLDFVMVAEKLAWACPAVAGAMNLNTMIADVLLVGGSEEQKKKYIGRLVKGEVGCYGLSEPGAGSDVAGISASAVKRGDRWVISGTKTWISNSTVGSFFIIFAKTDPGAGHRGITAFLVERDTPGLKVGNPLGKLGQKAFPACEVFLENVEVPDSQRLGGEGTGFFMAMKVFDRSRPMVAALGVGLSQRCVDESVKYARTRESKGKPIIAHQLVAAKIAEMAMRTEAARLLTHKSACLLDHGIPNTAAASMAKAFAADTAVFCSGEAVQVHGGMGYSPEYPVEKLYRDAKGLQIYEGTNEIQRLIIARELAGR